MKAIVIFAASLMITTTLFAQSSRRSENTQTNNRRSESASSTDRRSSSESGTEVSSRRSEPSSRTPQTVSTERGSSSSEVTPSSRRNYDNRPSERNQPPQTPRVQEPEKGQNTSITNRREQQSPASNRENYRREQQSPSQNREQNNRNDNIRREPNKPQEIVIESRRPVERRYSVVQKSYRPVPVEVRRVRSPYRAPVRAEIIWTVDLSRRYEVYYPDYRPYHYHVGSRIATISAYDAYDFVGEIARVYGRVNESYYSYETDEIFLYVGDYYPYQDFTVIIPAHEARHFSRRPERFFEGEYIEATGLISRFQGKPEMVVRRAEQIAVY
jgi:hypothetical protein